MRIAIVTPNFPSEPVDGMFLTMSLEIARGLKASGHELLILTLSDTQAGADMVEGMRVWRVKPDFETFCGLSFAPNLRLVSYWLHCSLLLFSSAQKVVDDFNPDVIEVQDFFALGLPWINDARYPVVMRVIGSLSEMIRNGSVDAPPMAMHFIDAIELATVSSATLALSLCQDIVERFNARANLPDGHITAIKTPLSIPPELPQPTKKSNAGNFPDILFWGRIDSQKGVDQLIGALPAVSREFPDFSLTLIGRVVDEKYLAALKQRLTEENLTEHVHFAGELSRDALIQRAVDADICVFPSRYETACYASLEAMSYGCCVVATAVGGIPEYIAHDHTGWLVSPNDHHDLANALIHLSKNPALRQRLAQRARVEIAQICDPVRSISMSEQAYCQAISRFTLKQRNQIATLPVINEILEGLRDRSFETWLAEQRTAAYKAGVKDGYEQARLQYESKLPVTPPSHQKSSIFRMLIEKAFNDRLATTFNKSEGHTAGSNRSQIQTER